MGVFSLAPLSGVTAPEFRVPLRMSDMPSNPQITYHKSPRFLIQQKVITKRKEGYSMHPVIPTEENASELLA